MSWFTSTLTITGQFWNIPVTATLYDGSLKEDYAADFDRKNLYLITVFPETGGQPRSFLGQWFDIAWDRRSGTFSSSTTSVLHLMIDGTHS